MDEIGADESGASGNKQLFHEWIFGSGRVTESERNIVGQIIVGRGWGLSRLLPRLLLPTAVTGIIHRCRATPPIEHLHFIGDDFSGIAILTVLALPLARLQPAFDVDLAALLEVFAGDLAEPIEHH